MRGEAPQPRSDGADGAGLCREGFLPNNFWRNVMRDEITDYEMGAIYLGDGCTYDRWVNEGVCGIQLNVSPPEAWDIKVRVLVAKCDSGPTPFFQVSCEGEANVESVFELVN